MGHSVIEREVLKDRGILSQANDFHRHARVAQFGQGSDLDFIPNELGCRAAGIRAWTHGQDLWIFFNHFSNDKFIVPITTQYDAFYDF